MANNGTFYLNEISDATPQLQAKLLEVLETRRIRRLGENSSRPVSFRLIAATNQDLAAEIREGRFRLDLYHRLNEIPLYILPLRQRTEDIPELVNHFLSQASPSTVAAGGEEYLKRLYDIFSSRDWLGNVRELRAEINRLWHVGSGDVARIVKLAVCDVSDTEREALLRLLREAGWNRREVARRLGISETTVRNRMKKHNL